MLNNVKKIATLIVRGEIKQLYYHIWVRFNNLDNSSVNYVSTSDGQQYCDSGGPSLAKAICRLKPAKSSVILEYGVGKGLAAIILSRYFDRVIGVDLSQELIDIARLNISKLRIRNISLYCEDARTFDAELDTITHIYMFHPFHRTVTVCAMYKVWESIKRNPRKVTVIYKAPYQHETLLASGLSHKGYIWLNPRQFGDIFSIYEFL